MFRKFDIEGTCKGKGFDVACTQFLYPRSNSEYLPFISWVGRTNDPNSNQSKNNGLKSMMIYEKNLEPALSRWADEDGIQF